MSDLVTFLRARLDEDEASTNAAIQPFLWGDRTGMKGLHPQVLQYVYRHVPGRELHEVEAKRRILDEHTPTGGLRAPVTDYHVEVCSTCGPDDFDDQHPSYRVTRPWGEGGFAHPGSYPCITVRLLALPYADHPDYDPAWRP